MVGTMIRSAIIGLGGTARSRMKQCDVMIAADANRVNCSGRRPQHQPRLPGPRHVRQTDGNRARAQQSLHVSTSV